MDGGIQSIHEKIISSLVAFDRKSVIATGSGAEWLCSLLSEIEAFIQHEHLNIQSNIYFISVILQQRYGSTIGLSFHDFIVRCFQTQGKNNTGTFYLDNLNRSVRLGLAAGNKEIILSVLESAMATHVKSTVQGTFDRCFLPSLKKWLETSVLGFIKNIYSPLTDEYESLSISLHNTLNINFVTIRSEELFEMVAEFPDSMIAVKELRDAATRSNNLHVIGKIFGKILNRRLLHMGASTPQILDMYVSVIKTLRVIDASDALLVYVTKPVRKYLKDRKVKIYF